MLRHSCWTINLIVVLILIFGLLANTLFADENKARQSFTAGLNSFQSEYWDEAIRNFQNTLKEDPDYYGRFIYSYIAYAYCFKGIYSEALIYYTQAIEKQATAGNYAGRGFVYHQINAPQKAIKDFLQAIKLEPNNKTFHLYLACLYQLQEEESSAIKEYEQVLLLDPSEEYLYEIIAYLYAQKGNYQKSVDKYSKIKNPSPQVQFNLGYITYYRLSNQETGQNYINQAERQLPAIFDNGLLYTPQPPKIDFYLFLPAIPPPSASVLASPEVAIKLKDGKTELLSLRVNDDGKIKKIKRTTSVPEITIPATEAVKAWMLSADNLETPPNEVWIASPIIFKPADKPRFIMVKPLVILEHYYLAFQYMDMQKYKESLQEFTTIQNMDFHNVLINNNIAYIYMLNNDLDNAKAKFNQTLKTKSDNPMANFYIASIDLEKGLYEQAITGYEKVKQLDNTCLVAQLKLAGAYLNRDEPDLAMKIIQPIVTQNPNMAEAHLCLGIAYKKQKETIKAISEFEKTIQLDANNKQAHIELGDLYIEQKDFAKAVDIFQVIISFEPNMVEAHFKLGVAYKKIKQIDKAIIEYKKAIELDPTYVNAYIFLGVLYFEQANWELAIESFELAVIINPSHSTSRLYLGIAYRKKNDFDKAIEQYEIAIMLNPNYYQAHKNLGVVYLNDKEDSKMALFHFEESLRIAPNQKGAEQLQAIVDQLKLQIAEEGNQ